MDQRFIFVTSRFSQLEWIVKTMVNRDCAAEEYRAVLVGVGTNRDYIVKLYPG